MALITKLMETPGMRVFKRGFEKAVELLQKGEEKGVFAWAQWLYGTKKTKVTALP